MKLWGWVWVELTTDMLKKKSKFHNKPNPIPGRDIQLYTVMGEQWWFLLLHSPHSFLLSDPASAWSLWVSLWAPLVYFPAECQCRTCNAHCGSSLRRPSLYKVSQLWVQTKVTPKPPFSALESFVLGLCLGKARWPWSSQSPQRENRKDEDRRGATVCVVWKEWQPVRQKKPVGRPVISRNQRNRINYSHFSASQISQTRCKAVFVSGISYKAGRLTLRVLKTCIIPSNLSPFRLNSGCRFLTFFIYFYFLYILMSSPSQFLKDVLFLLMCVCVCEFIGSTPT